MSLWVKIQVSAFQPMLASEGFELGTPYEHTKSMTLLAIGYFSNLQKFLNCIFHFYNQLYNLLCPISKCQDMIFCSLLNFRQSGHPCCIMCVVNMIGQVGSVNIKR